MVLVNPSNVPNNNNKAVTILQFNILVSTFQVFMPFRTPRKTTMTTTCIFPYDIHILSYSIFLFQPHNRPVSCCIFLAALAVTDNLLMLNCFDLSLMSGILVDSYSHNHCRFSAYSFRVSGVSRLIDPLKSECDYLYIGWSAPR